MSRKEKKGEKNSENLKERRGWREVKILKEGGEGERRKVKKKYQHVNQFSLENLFILESISLNFNPSNQAFFFFGR